MSDYVVIIPAMNEQASIAKVLLDIRKYHNCDVIVVDDGSIDNTVSVARQHGAIVLPHVMNMGAWRATQTGIRYALKKEYDNVVTLDADGQHNALDIEKLIMASQLGIDLVIGSCTSRGSTGRHVVWKIIKKLTGLPVSDLTSGFRCYSKSAMQVLVSKQASMFEYQDVGVLLMLKHINMKCAEVAVSMDERQDGISRIFNSWLAVGKYLLYTFILSATKFSPISAKTYHKKLTSGDNLD
jgi:glycosyltransferase involved in cell wall biosynthesis